jgi:hypothetical protein
LCLSYGVSFHYFFRFRVGVEARFRGKVVEEWPTTRPEPGPVPVTGCAARPRAIEVGSGAGAMAYP